MKHGPISLIDETIPIVALVPLDSLHEKMLSNISEAKARGGKVIAIASEGDDLISTKADHVVRIPNCTENLNPFLLTLPLQTLAYHTGVKRGCDVDQPRNQILCAVWNPYSRMTYMVNIQGQAEKLISYLTLLVPKC